MSVMLNLYLSVMLYIQGRIQDFKLGGRTYDSLEYILELFFCIYV